MSVATDSSRQAQAGDGRAGDRRAGDKSSQYLTFVLGDEEYGVDILRVQEIRGWDRATPIPNTPDYVRGVINLRGAVVPIIDLRRRFKKETIPYTSTTVVIVVKVFSEKGEKVVGVAVDAVSDVRNINEAELQPTPDLGVDHQGFVKGLATLRARRSNDAGKQAAGAMIILLDVDHLLDITLPSKEANGQSGPAKAKAS
jgi:purine-binding chemotaxis protein CheW